MAVLSKYTAFTRPGVRKTICGLSGENIWKNMMRDIEEIKNHEIK
jgi:hypothetical protein